MSPFCHQNRETNRKIYEIASRILDVVALSKWNSGHLSHRACIFGLCRLFSFARDVNMMLRI
jgi:hypothetical protein